MTDVSPALTVACVAERLALAGCVYAEEEATILCESSPTSDDLAARVARRCAGEPLEHVVGWTLFRGLRLAVDAGVFVPRPRSGFLVEQAASEVRGRTVPGRKVLVVDLCCGVGAVGAALAAEQPPLELHAADCDPRAVACARANLAAWGGQVHEGDLFDALPRRLRGRIDVVVASPPYVPTGEIRLLPAEARDHEPGVALDGGSDGLDLVRRIVHGARRWLAPGGCLVLEVGESQVERAADELAVLGGATRAVTSEDDGSAVAVGRRSR